MKKYILTIVALILMPLVFTQFQDREFELSKNLDIYHTLMRELNLFYVDETDPGQLIKASIDHMLRTLDPYTAYIPESQMEDLQLMTTGEYGGVGALIRQKDDYVMITDPYQGFPAERAGLRAGDIIREIDGRKVTELSSAQISELMKGQVGTEIKMKVDRPFGKNAIPVKMTREKVKITNVPYYDMIGSETGYIRLSGFTQGAALEVIAAFNDLKDRGMKNIVLDLRSNPGGLLIEAVDIMNIFVPYNQEIVSTIGKVKQWNKTYYCRRQPIDTLIPVAVMINSKSASAAEIVAGAMQDLDRGVVIGERSFGKGLVQTTRDLSYNSKLKLTTAKYYIPSGRCIQALDYSNRRSDGSVGQIPDSLITSFQTLNGRTVYDGGGIVPDIKEPAKLLSRLSSSLVYDDRFFDFATQMRNTNDQIETPANYSLSTKEYDEFVGQLIRDTFSYQTATSRKLTELVEVAKREKYFDQSEDELDALQAIYQTDLEKDCALFKDEITSVLSEEIISRYYYLQGRIAFMLREDESIEEAKQVLSDQAAYHQILSK